MIDSLSFSGIYLIKFPKSYSNEMIKEKREDLQKHIEENNYMYMESLYRENIQPQNENQSTSDILMTTTIDNPGQIYDTLSVINPNLADQFVDKTKVYLNLDTIA